MAEAVRPSTPDAPVRVLDPLWSVPLFLGLAEAAVGVAATRTHGWIQGMLAIFAVVFPAAVATTFFRILLTRPFAPHAPKDHPAAPSIEAYATAAGASIQDVEEVVRLAVEEIMIPRLPATEREQTEALVAATVRTAREDFRRRSVMVDITGLAPQGPIAVLSFPVESMTVARLLDTIYLTVRDEVKVYSYRQEWLLHDPETGTTFTDIGGHWAEDGLRLPHDGRSLEEVGIRPGAILRAVRADR